MKQERNDFEEQLRKKHKREKSRKSKLDHHYDHEDYEEYDDEYYSKKVKSSKKKSRMRDGF